MKKLPRQKFFALRANSFNKNFEADRKKAYSNRTAQEEKDLQIIGWIFILLTVFFAAITLTSCNSQERKLLMDTLKQEKLRQEQEAQQAQAQAQEQEQHEKFENNDYGAGVHFFEK